MSRDLDVCQTIADRVAAAVEDCIDQVPKCCDTLEPVATFGGAHPLPGYLSCWLVSRVPLANARRPSSMSPNTWTIGLQWVSRGHPSIADGKIGQIPAEDIDRVTCYFSDVHEAIRGALVRLPGHLYPETTITQDTPLTPKGRQSGGTFRVTMVEPRGEK